MKKIKTIFICFVFITWSIITKKMMHISYEFLNSRLLLQKCCKVYKSKYQVLKIFFIKANANNNNFAIIIFFVIGSKINNFSSDLLLS